MYSFISPFAMDLGIVVYFVAARNENHAYSVLHDHLTEACEGDEQVMMDLYNVEISWLVPDSLEAFSIFDETDGRRYTMLEVFDKYREEDKTGVMGCSE